MSIDSLSADGAQVSLSPIPNPVSNLFGKGRFCSLCGCSWFIAYGVPNQVEDQCESERCACHDVRFATAVYEGAAA